MPSYVAALEAKAAALAQGQCPYRDMGFLMAWLRVTTSGRHHIFCLARENAPALVLAILHERMDLMVRLQERLRV